MASNTTLTANSVNVDTLNSRHVVLRNNNSPSELQNQSTTNLLKSSYPSGSLVRVDWTGVTGSTTINLPSADQEGYHIDIVCTGAIANTNTLVIAAATGDVFNSNSYAIPSDATAVHNNGISNGSHNTLTLTSAATDNSLGAGTMISCKCVAGGQWFIQAYGAGAGTGAAGSMIFS